jgi:hypothetical protein
MEALDLMRVTEALDLMRVTEALDLMMEVMNMQSAQTGLEARRGRRR